MRLSGKNMAYDHAKNMQVIAVTARTAEQLGGLFGFDVEYGGDDMLALQASILDIFGKRIDAGQLNAAFAAELIV